MKKKIFGTFVMILLLVPAIPTVTCINNIDSFTTSQSTTKADLQAIMNEIQKLEIIPSTNSINNLKNIIIYVDDDAPHSWYDATHVKTIQEGIYKASAGGTVFVYNGTYGVLEGIIINLPLNLIGEDKYNTVIMGNERGDPIKIRSSKVNINNFTVKKSKRQDASKTYAGIRIADYYKNINISNNILTENSQGIMMGSTSYVNIYENEIYNNDYDGIVLQTCQYCLIDNNTIYNNGYNYLPDSEPNGDGIDIRNSNYNIIQNNNISNNKIDGIWLDGVQNLSNNLFLNNQILGNEQCGIHFGSSNSSDCIIKNNTFSNNLIKNNNKGGILIRYAKDNYIFENNIEENGVFGIKILYIDGKNLISENNKIYHNNLIKNGEYELFYKPDNKKYCNGADSNNGILSSAKLYNQWDNGTIDNKINANLSSEKGGNYWNDYEELYKKVFADDELRYHGIWNLEYHMKIQLNLYFFKGFINKKINLDSLESKASDQYPWCRRNGWDPSRPDKPLLNASPNFINPKKYSIACCTNDSNEDKIIYEINITKSETDETITSGWQIINAEPINASRTAYYFWTFNEYGSYNIYIRAYDVRDGNDNFGKGYDGKSEITQITIRIE